MGVHGQFASAAPAGIGHRRAQARMIARLRARGIGDPRVLEAMATVERHRLVPEVLRHRAYDDAALPIGDGQTISAPGVVAEMTQALGLHGCERVLEVGTGSAYQAAVLSRLASRVVSVERIPALARRARRVLAELDAHNVAVQLGDGTLGWPPEGPYDAIVVTAGGPEVPAPLLAQLAPGGRLVGPFGGRDAQELLCIDRDHAGRDVRTSLGACRFVDLVGSHGWGD